MKGDSGVSGAATFVIVREFPNIRGTGLIRMRQDPRITLTPLIELRLHLLEEKVLDEGIFLRKSTAVQLTEITFHF